MALLVAAGPPQPAGAQDLPLATDPDWATDDARASVGVAWGDVDGDGDLDLAYGNLGQTNTLYRNDEGRLITTPIWESEPIDETWAVAFGDLDGDGDLDLVCGNRRQPSRVHANVGGMLSTAPSWSSAPLDLTVAVALVDIDLDGDLDLVCGNELAANTIYRNEGGTLTALPFWSSSGPSRTFAVSGGDLDDDGDLDLVFGNFSESNTAYLNDRGSYPSTPDWYSRPTSGTRGVALGDLDGDGDLDLACGNRGDPDVVYRNDGGDLDSDPSWSSASSDDTMAIALGDLDGDGDLDLVGAGWNQANVAHASDGVSFGGDPSWSSSPANATEHVALGDVDGDGDLDLAVANHDQRDMLYRNDAAPLRQSPVWRSATADPVRDVMLFDVDGDLDLDLICGNRGQPTRLYANVEGRLDTVPVWSTSTAQLTIDIAIADVDGDGAPDLACANEGPLNTLRAGEGGVFSVDPTWTWTQVNTTAVDLADVDVDGAPDLICVSDRAPNTVRLNRNGAFGTATDWASPALERTFAVALGDLDGDGAPELVCANLDAPNTAYLNGGGDFGTAAAWSSSQQNDTDSIALGDVDGDGDLDLIFGNLDQANTLYRNDAGQIGVVPVWFSSPTHGTRDVALADIDGDGDLDLVCANADAPVVIYENDGGTLRTSPGWSSPGSAPEELVNVAVATGDIDDDGDLDLVCGRDGARDVVHDGARAPAYGHDPVSPIYQLPNNGAVLREVRVTGRTTNIYDVTLVASDVEEDAIWLTADVQFVGDRRWTPAALTAGGRQGLELATSAAGTPHRLTWDVSTLPVDPRDLVLRLRAISLPGRSGEIQHVSPHHRAIGRIEVRRPEIRVAAGPLRFPAVTVGDTAAVELAIANSGNEVLVVTGLELPSTAMGSDRQPPFEVGAGATLAVMLSLAPRVTGNVSGAVIITSNDPAAAVIATEVTSDVRALTVDTQALVEGAVVPLGDAVTVQVIPEDGVVVERGAVHFRATGGSGAFAAAELTPIEGSFFGIIPGEAVTEAGVDYYVEIENSGVLATDPPDAPAMAVYRLAVESPAAITSYARPSAGTAYLAGRPIDIELFLPAGAELAQGVLHYRRGGESDYATQALESAGPVPIATIPAAAVGARGIEYWVAATTLTRALTDPAVDPVAAPHTIQVTVSELAEDVVHPGGQYRMLSVPLVFGDEFSGTLEALLFDEPAFGSYDPRRWRSFRYLPERGDYLELSDAGGTTLFRPEPGRAFWLVSAEDHRVTTAPITGASTPTAGAFELALAPGWNQIASPFAFAVLWDSLRIDGLPVGEVAPGVLEPPVAWGGEIGYVHDEPTLAPFEGYWVRNLTAGPVILEFPPRAPAMSRVRARPDGADDATSPPARSAIDPAGSWRIAIEATGAGLTDRHNVVGVEIGAAAEWDPLDRAEPPPGPGPALVLAFPHDDWSRHGGLYAVDLRAPALPTSAAAESGTGHVWCFDVALDGKGIAVEPEVRLVVAGLSTLPAGHRAVVVDRQLGRVIGSAEDGLADGATLTVLVSRTRPASRPDEARFRLLVGDARYLDTALAAAPAAPTVTVLHQNHPNPFNPVTVIRYELARPGGVTLRVYDVSGALVATLVDGESMPGRYELVWDGRDARGRRLAAGVYFCRLQTSCGVTRASKLVLAP